MSPVKRRSLTPCSRACSCTIRPPISTHCLGSSSTRSPTAAQSSTVSRSSSSMSISLMAQEHAQPRDGRVARRSRAGPPGSRRAARGDHHGGPRAATPHRPPSEREPAPPPARERAQRRSRGGGWPVRTSRLLTRGRGDPPPRRLRCRWPARRAGRGSAPTPTDGLRTAPSRRGHGVVVRTHAAGGRAARRAFVRSSGPGQPCPRPWCCPRMPTGERPRPSPVTGAGRHRVAAGPSAAPPAHPATSCARA
jgi:hypothetical protein